MSRDTRIQVDEIPKPYPCRKCEGRGIEIIHFPDLPSEGLVGMPDEVRECKACGGWGLIFPRRRASIRRRRSGDFDVAGLLSGNGTGRQ